MPVLVKFRSDYADEFDVEQLRVFLDRSVEEVELEIERICEASKTEEFYFGTNECLEDLREISFTVKEMSAEAAEELIVLLDIKPYEDYTFGTGILGHFFS